MKPAPFAYVAPRSLGEALALMTRHGDEGKALAGGQSLLPVLNFRLAQPAVLVDLNAVPELELLAAADDGGLRMGALTRHRQLEREPLVAARAPLLAEAVHHIAHPQIRNRGTVGGSLAHADPKAELPALAVALRARFKLQREGGERWIDAADFYTGLFSTELQSDELLTEVVWPAQPAGSGWAFEEAARRHGDYAQVGVAAIVRLDDAGRCADARLVFLAVGDGPLVASRAAAALVGEAPGEAPIAAAANVAGEEIEPRGDVHASPEFKRHLARVLTARVLRRAFARATDAGQAEAPRG
ncbi:MAG TPA: xanthine dehydrogenase family protein subunit M [Thermoanaerobaculia bacterium]|jgi:carbon-monoxide dehydrogenase medium subunit|nr:xanthine dehydrogenase family protein subunit M [Thermoanaerobaculia bacterium]